MMPNDINNLCQICNKANNIGDDRLCGACRKDLLPFNCLPNQDLINTILETNAPNYYKRLQEIETDIFNPDMYNDIHNIMEFDNIDPDINYFNNQNVNCNYYLEDDINRIMNQNPDDNLCSFAITHWNIRSAPKNLESMEYYLQNVNIKFDIIGLTETWFNENNVNRYDMDGYVHEYNYRKSRKGGGVSLFIKNNIKYKPRADLDVICESAEALFIEVSKDVVGCDKNIVIGCIYRPPDSNIETFIRSLSNIFNRLNRENNMVYLMGDFNINLLNVNSHRLTADFIETIFSYSFLPLINKPTRVKSNSASIIDNIFCNNFQNKEMLSGVLCTDISDHFPIFCVIQFNNVKLSPEFIIKRLINENNINKFKTGLALIDWINIVSNDNYREAFSNFHSTFTKLYEDCFPFKRVKISYSNRKPWLTPGLKKSIKTKNKLYINSIKNPSDENCTKYHEYKRTLNKLLRNSERMHYDDLFKQNIGNIKKSWDLIREVINKKPSKLKTTDFNIDGRRVDDDKLIANSFNEYYIDIGCKISQSLPSIQKTFSSFMPASNPSSIFLKPTNCDEVKSIIEVLKKKSPGWDGLDPVVIKETFPYFINTLTTLINRSMTEGYFPDELKTAKVIPLFKNNDASLINNYRPVSILSTFSKIFERIMYNRLMSFINKHNLLYKFQFGFRKDYNTNLALITLIDKISDALDSGKNVVGVFLDFSKAFDTVNHEILLKKLDIYGIRGMALKWLTSYLESRTQFVSYNGVQSIKDKVRCGVPQGSVLGPLLYLLYVNDMANVSTNILPILFADDTNVFIEGNNIDTIIEKMNLEMNKLVEWTIANKLSLNVDKTNYMIFKTKGKRVQSRLSVNINNKPLKQVKSSKFLGVIIDEHLSWNEHTKYLKSKLSKAIGILCKARKVLNVSTLVTIYNSFIYPYLTYGVEVWGNAVECNIKPIITLQKRAIRMINSAHYRAHTPPLFKRLNLLPFKDVFTSSVAKVMFKIMKNLTPRFLKDMFTVNSNLHHHITRQCHKLHIPMARTNIRKKSFRYEGVHIWNNIMSKINLECTFATFKRRIKEYLTK